MAQDRPDLALSTLCAHAGAPASRDVGAGARAHVSPIYQQTVFDFATVADSEPAIAGQAYVYRRNGMPNADELGGAVAALEGAEAGVATGSGMGAIAAVVLATCQAGDRVLVQRDAYGGTPALLEGELARFGVVVESVDVYRPAEIAVDGVRLLLVESISNPLLRIAPLAELTRRCRAAGALVCVDNTFATPLAMRPLEDGADIVVHSATKFLGGHHDASVGVVCGAAALMAPVRKTVVRFGFHPAPMDAWLAVRGLRTLEVRMQRAWRNAADLADFLGAHPAVRAVHRAERCALVTFDVGARARADAVVAGCSLITLSPSLGGVTTTLSHPATSSHVAMSAHARADAGIGDGLLRMCVGVEDAADLWRDLSAGLAAI